ncbi:hypothetical protein GCM10010483_06720 [Actinokineospora diospyrosa]
MLKIRRTNLEYNPVPPNVPRIFSWVPLEATQYRTPAASSASSTSDTPGTAVSSVASAAVCSSWNRRSHTAAAGRPSRSAITSAIEVADRPTKRLITSASVMGQPRSGPTAMFARIAIGSLSTSTPSQSKITKAGCTP